VYGLSADRALTKAFEVQAQKRAKGL